MRDDRERLLDLREAIERIEKYTAAGRLTLEHDELIQTWVIYLRGIIFLKIHRPSRHQP